MKNKETGIFVSIVTKYIIFVAVLIVLLVFTCIFAVYQLEKSVDNGMLPKVRAVDIVRSDFENMDIDDISELGGWTEILDENLNVVYIKGDKKDDIYKYSQEKIFTLLNMTNKEKSFGLLQYFKGINGSTYYCLVKYPSNKIKINFQFNNPSYKSFKMFYNSLIKAAVFFIILFIINVLLFSMWNSKNINKPLKKITTALRKMTEGAYDTRLNFKAEKEFALIRDSFNYMAEKLEIADREKKEIEASKTNMLMDLSHDIKTPITTIQGFSKALSEGIVEDEVKKNKYLKTIYNKSLRVSSLIDDLFQFVKLESAEYNISKSSVDIVEFVREIVVEYYEEIEEKSFMLDLRMPHKEIFVRIDKKLMERALGNIIVNSLKYNSKDTKLRIEIIDGDGEVIIEIADNGIVISNDVKDKIFGVFVRGNKSRKSDGGSGLGLAISKKIVEKHSGKIYLNCGSNDEVTIFSILLRK